MSDVLDYVRSKDPAFTDVPDAELTRYVAARKPEFLQDPQFKQDYENLGAEALSKSAQLAVRTTGEAARSMDVFEAGRQAQLEQANKPPDLGTPIIADPLHPEQVNPPSEFSDIGPTGLFKSGAAIEAAKIAEEPLFNLVNPLTEEEKASLTPTQLGVFESVKENANQLSTTKNLMLLGSAMGVAKLGVVAARAVALGFAAMMGKQVPEIASQLGEQYALPEDQRDQQKIAKLITDGAIATGFTTLTALHGLTPETPATRTARVAAKELSKSVEGLDLGGIDQEAILKYAPQTAQALAETGKPAVDFGLPKDVPSNGNEPVAVPGPASPVVSAKAPEAPPPKEQTETIRRAIAAIGPERFAAGAAEFGRQKRLEPEDAQNTFAHIVDRVPKYAESFYESAGKETSAVPEQKPNEEVLRNQQPEVGLPQVGEGNAKPEEAAGAQGQAPIGEGQVGTTTIEAPPKPPETQPAPEGPPPSNKPTTTAAPPEDMTGMGGATPGEFSGSTGADVYGIAARVREERRIAGQADQPGPGQGAAPGDALAIGRELLNKDSQAGFNVLDAFEKDPNKAVSEKGFAAVVAQGERFALKARNAEESFGTDSPEFRAAQKDLEDWDARSKPMQTESHKVFVAQQGEIDIDTGSFSGLQRAFKDATGRDIEESKRPTAERIARQKRESDVAAEQAKQKVLDKVKAETEGTPTPVESKVKAVADKLRSYFSERATTALERIKQRRAEGRTYIGGIDPEAMRDYADYGASKIVEKGIEGAEMSAEWASEMVAELGDYIKPHLKDIWDAAKQSLEAAMKLPDEIRKKVIRTASRDATKAALDAASKTVRENAIRLADAENKSRVAKTVEERSTAKVQEDAARKALEDTTKKARELTVKSADAENKARVKAAEPVEDLQAKAAKKALDAANKVVTRTAKSLADAENKARLAKTDAEKAAAEAQVKRNKAIADAASKKARESAIAAAKAEVKERVARADRPAYVWSKAREYIDKGMDNYDQIRNKLATDLGLSVDQVTAALGKIKGIKPLADDMWRKQQVARNMNQRAELWLNDQAMSTIQRIGGKIPSGLFRIRVGGHGFVALGTHAPMGLFKPLEWPLYFKNYGRMVRMVVDPAFYERKMQDLVRDPNYPIANRSGLQNDPFKYEEYTSPDTIKGVKLFLQSGTRGYSVLKLLRQDMFNREWNSRPKTQQIPEVARALSNDINHATGVTKAAAPKGSSVVLFAPRLLASRVAWMAVDPLKAVHTFYNWKNATMEEKTSAIYQTKEKLWVAGTAYTLLLANQAFLNSIHSNQKVNFDDPLRSDWMKFKIAGMNVAYGSAMLSMARFPSRLWQIRQSGGGKLKNLIYPDEDSYHAVGEFARSQLSPIASLAADLWFKGDWQNRPLPNSQRPVPKRLRAQGVKPYTWPEFWTEQALPIPFQEAAREVWKTGLGFSDEQVTHMFKALAIISAMAMTGARVTDDVESQKRTKAEEQTEPEPN
ncbi:MAG: hypothetical protein V4563_14195 [Pseudomonadota bacterium]